MKIELRNVKHSPSLSQETNAYTADVWVDGVKRGTVRNAGHGGPDEIQPHALWRELADYAKTLPPVKVPWGKGEMENSIDIVLGDLLTRHLEGKRLQRMMKTKVVLVKGGKCFTVKTAEAAFKAGPGEEVLNRLPFEDALTKFLEAATA